MISSLPNNPIPDPTEINNGMKSNFPALLLTTIMNLMPNALTCRLYSVLFMKNASEYLFLTDIFLNNFSGGYDSKFKINYLKLKPVTAEERYDGKSNRSNE
jgi:hypothetical protein